MSAHARRQSVDSQSCRLLDQQHRQDRRTTSARCAPAHPENRGAVVTEACSYSRRVSLSFRLKDLLGPATSVKKKKKKMSARFAPAPPVAGFAFRVSGFAFQVSGLGIRVAGCGFRVSGFGFRVSGLGFQVSGFGFRASCFGFHVSGLGVMSAKFHWRRKSERCQNQYCMLASGPCAAGDEPPDPVPQEMRTIGV